MEVAQEVRRPHERRARLPMTLVGLHAATALGDVVTLRLSPSWAPAALADVVAGGGFDVDAVARDDAAWSVRCTRARTLPDVVGPGMRLLVCGLNPSLYAADRGVGYARPGNRFWPAALEAAVVRRDRDPLDALHTCGLGMTDLVKRATVAAAELEAHEYREGAARVERLVRWLRPGAVCFVGLAGWRAAVDPAAAPGLQPRPFGGRPAYVMPSTSGLNAHASLAQLADHLRAARALAP